MSNDPILTVLTAIADHLEQSLVLADHNGETLIAARIQEACSAVSDRRDRIMRER